MKLIPAIVAFLLAATAFVATAGSAWAAPCAPGERLVGATEKVWLCQNIATGITREVLK
jgi:hypothetical protein